MQIEVESITRVFKDKDYLWSVKFKGEEQDEITRLFCLWTSPEYLYKFMEEHAEYFKSPFWIGKEATPANTAKIALDQSKRLVKELAQLKQNIDKGKQYDFDKFFIPLSLNYNDEELKRVKAYSPTTPQNPDSVAIFRLYAIWIESNVYIITGGGIKLVKEMRDMPELTKELQKIRVVREWLEEQGVASAEQITIVQYECD